MPDGNIMAGWILLFYGLYTFAAGAGELRHPGTWLKMIEEITSSAVLPFLTGVVCILMGSFTLFLMGGQDGPILNKVLIVFAAWIVVEGLLFIMLPDNFGRFAGWLMKMSSRFWALASMAFGLALIGGGLLYILG